jgi:hypothetical protein
LKDGTGHDFPLQYDANFKSKVETIQNEILNKGPGNGWNGLKNSAASRFHTVCKLILSEEERISQTEFKIDQINDEIDSLTEKFENKMLASITGKKIINGGLYIGELNRETLLPEGLGTFMWDNHDIYEGKFSNNNRFEDIAATWISRLGYKYKGGFVNNDFCGYGLYLNPDGSVFHQGMWEYDHPSKSGIRILADNSFLQVDVKLLHSKRSSPWSAVAYTIELREIVSNITCKLRTWSEIWFEGLCTHQGPMNFISHPQYEQLSSDLNSSQSRIQLLEKTNEVSLFSR